MTKLNINKVFKSLKANKEIAKKINTYLRDTYIYNSKQFTCNGETISPSLLGTGIGIIYENDIYKIFDEHKEEFGIKELYHEYYGGNTWPDYKFVTEDGNTVKIDCKSTLKQKTVNTYKKFKSFMYGDQYYSYVTNTNYASRNMDNFDIYRYCKAYNVIVYYNINIDNRLEVINILLVPNIFANIKYSVVNKNTDNKNVRLAFNGFDVEMVYRYYNDDISDKELKEYITNKIQSLS